MARGMRIHSLSGYMHIITRGIGRQVLFEDEQDHCYYISLLKKYSLETTVSICAYCLMSNHTHLLVYDSGQHISEMMKKINVCYAHYYNNKYERTGHLFQDRFLSEPIDEIGYLLTVFRYVLNNPEKAGICRAAEYRWSSYKDIYSDKSFVKTAWLQDILGNDYSYKEFMRPSQYDECMEYESGNTDEEAGEKMKRLLQIESGTELQTYSKTKRDDALRLLKANGLTVRQIARLTGIGRGIVQRA